MRIFLIIFPILFTSCMTMKQADQYCAQKYKTETKDSIVYKEVLKDTTIYSDSDSMWLAMYVECGDSNQVLIQKLDEKNSGLKTEVIYEDKFIYIKSKSEPKPIKIFFKDTSSFQKFKKASVVEIYKDKPYPWWVKFLMWSGVAFYILIFLFLLYKYLRIRYKL